MTGNTITRTLALLVSMGACDAGTVEDLRTADDPCTYVADDNEVVSLSVNEYGFAGWELGLPSFCDEATIEGDVTLNIARGTKLATEGGEPIEHDGELDLAGWGGVIVVVEPIPCDPSIMCCKKSRPLLVDIRPPCRISVGGEWFPCP